MAASDGSVCPAFTACSNYNNVIYTICTLLVITLHKLEEKYLFIMMHLLCKYPPSKHQDRNIYVTIRKLQNVHIYKGIVND